MANVRGSVQVAPKVRGAFIRALQIVEGSKQDKKYAGMSLSEILADMIMEGEVETVINMASRFTPKEMLLDLQGELKIDTAQMNPNLIKEVFSGTGIETGPVGDVAEVQGGDTLEAPERSPIRGLP